MQIQLICERNGGQEQLNTIAQKWQLTEDKNSQFALVLTEKKLELRKLDEPKLGAIFVDFVNGAAAHRRKYGGGKGQAIAKATGLNKGNVPVILDATAGLGRDAFVLASLGCQVQMIERHPVVAAILDDGLERAKNDSEIGLWVSERLSLLHNSSHNALEELRTDPNYRHPDVIYLDPMFPIQKTKRSKLW